MDSQALFEEGWEMMHHQICLNVHERDGKFRISLNHEVPHNMAWSGVVELLSLSARLESVVRPVQSANYTFDASKHSFRPFALVIYIYDASCARLRSYLDLKYGRYRAATHSYRPQECCSALCVSHV